MTTLYSPAKINLYLDVLRKREDGFHEIQSIFQLIDLYDEIEVLPSDDFSLTISNKSSPFAFREDLTQNNLLEKIYHYFRENYKIPPFSLKLIKKIPIGAGLGGGSSNAATLITHINKEYQLGLSSTELMKIGAVYGSDIPFFIDATTAVVTGRGENIEKIQIQKDLPFHLMVVYPDIHVSTKVAYEKYVTFGQDENFELCLNFLTKKRNENSLKKIALPFYNAFQSKLVDSEKKIGNVFSVIRDFGCFPLLSGSGSSIIVFVPLGMKTDELKMSMREFTSYVYEVAMLTTRS